MEALEASILYLIGMSALTTSHNYKQLAWTIALCEFTGLLIGLLSLLAAGNWYIHLNKPVFTPPTWLFGPTWVILYLFMGIGLHQMIRYGNGQPAVYKHSLALFWVQLTLNVCWSLAFFVAKSPLLSFVIILGLIGSVCFWIQYLHRIQRFMAWLQVPYLLWCCFAMIFNYYIIRLN